MQVFRVDDMTCGHCVSTITKALKATDQHARITIDLARHLVMVEPTEVDAKELGDAITEAGYTPVPVQAPTAVASPPRAGGCCGCRGAAAAAQA